MTYVPLTYLQDIILLIAELRLEKVVAVGTSLGGILTMLLAATDRERLAGAVLNDVGPVLDPAGLERIRTYVGRRSEERRVGKECVSTCRSRWSPSHNKKKKNKSC